jgi:hypothetical protein
VSLFVPVVCCVRLPAVTLVVLALAVVGAHGGMLLRVYL